MNVANITQGFSAFVAFGLRWPDQSRQAQDRAAARPIIDVEATPIQNETPQAKTRSLAFSQASASDASPQIASYAPPTRAGQAPRILYIAQQRGQVVETWA